jgi:predicted MFS family arabinose efflux permease
VAGFIESANLGWKNPLVFGSLIASVCFFVGFVLVEARATSPMVPLTIFASRSFSGANLLTLFLYAAMGIFFFLFPLNLIQVQGYSATQTGAAVLPFILLMFFLSRWSGGLVARYGPRLPLVVGPIIVALGFVLFAVPSIAGHYWSAFLPPILVLGLGMAVTVAPLTTVVMNSVDQDRVGTASGINNAVARVAGVLAIAVFGVVMVSAFSSHLTRSLAHLPIPLEVARQLKADAIKLAGLQLPAGIDSSQQAAVRQSIAAAFVSGFRIVMIACAGLAMASAIIARRVFPKRARSSAPS